MNQTGEQKKHTTDYELVYSSTQRRSDYPIKA